MKVPFPVHPFKNVPEVGRQIVDVESRIVLAGGDEQVLRQRQLPLAEDRIRLGEQFLRGPLSTVRDVPLAADREQERMNAGRVHRVDSVDAGEDGRDQRAGDLVDQLAERRVRLGRSADDGERPDRVRAVCYPVHPHHREVVRQAVVPEVVAEWSFKFRSRWVDRPRDAKIRLGRDRQARHRSGQPHPPPAQGAGEQQFRHPFGQRHHGREHQGGRAADSDVHAQWFLPADRRGVVNADSTVNLVVQPDLAVRFVLVARKLDPVHAEIRLPPARLVGMLRVDQR